MNCVHCKLETSKCLVGFCFMTDGMVLEERSACHNMGYLANLRIF